ncbi:hypothetical protein DFH09DRAFT_1309825 [Mycena vulgaris]|nr:hypothetical protein DFH09DRAFT_1309825 [Mycena vulgaris]
MRCISPSLNGSKHEPPAITDLGHNLLPLTLAFISCINFIVDAAALPDPAASLIPHRLIPGPPAKKVKARHQVDLTQYSFFDSPLAKPKPAPKDKHPPTVLRPLVWLGLPPDCPTVLVKDLVHKAGAAGAGVAWIDLQICDAIGKANKRESVLKDGEEHAWPTTIDYAALPARILALDTQILRMIEDPIVLDNSPICYGPKGEFLITSTIIRMLALKEDDLGNRLYETLVTIVKENPDVFDKYDEDSALICIKDFVSFILTPFAATLLISEEKGLSYEDATGERDASNVLGELMQPEDDNPISPAINQHASHTVHDATSAKSKPKQKKEITLSLDDFPELNVKSRKPPHKEKKSGGKKMASDIKSKALAAAPPTGCSTRSKTKIQVAAAGLEPESD